MIIKFDESNLCSLPKFKGGEKELTANMFFDGTNRMFRGCLAPGASIGLHTHEDSCEVIFILSGKGNIIEIDNVADSSPMTSLVEEGDCLYCPKGHAHSLINSSETEDLIFYATVAEQ